MQRGTGTAIWRGRNPFEGRTEPSSNGLAAP
jgi:hypothetical protein